MAIFKKKVTLKRAKEHFNAQTHLEASRSDAAEEYVWKEESRVMDTQFELGKKPMNRAKKDDWDKVLADAKKGDMDEIPADI